MQSGKMSKEEKVLMFAYGALLLAYGILFFKKFEHYRKQG